MTIGSFKWALWLFAIAISFAAMEAWALYDNTSTLSRFVWNITNYFPPFPYFVGFTCGFLTCHFWWGGIVPFAPVPTLGPPTAPPQEAP